MSYIETLTKVSKKPTGEGVIKGSAILYEKLQILDRAGVHYRHLCRFLL